MPQAYYPDGTPIPDDKLDEAMATKQLRYSSPAEKVTLVDRELGDKFEVDAKDLAGVDPRQYRLETGAEGQRRALEKEYGGAGQAAIALGEGALSGASLGLGNAALAAALGEDYRKAAQARELVQGDARLAGEIGAGLATAFATGGGSAAAQAGAKGAGLAARGASGALKLVSAPGRALARGGAAVERGVAGALGRAGLAEGGVLSRAASLGASGAFEGGLYEAGQAIEDSFTRGDELTAEKVLAATGHGALWGLAGGAGMGAAIGTTAKAGRKVVDALGGADALKAKALKRIGLEAGDTLEEGAQKLAADNAVQALDPSKAQLKKLTQGYKRQDRAAEVGQELLDSGIVRARASKESMLARASQVAQESGEAIGESFQQLTQAGKNFTRGESLVSRLDDIVGSRKGQLVASHNRVGKAFEREFQPLKQAIADGVPLSHEDIHGVRRKLDEAIKWSKEQRAPIQDDLVKARRVLEEELEESADQAFKELGDETFSETYRTHKRRYGAARFAEDALLENASRGQANLSYGLLENIQGAGGLVAGAATGHIGLGLLGGAALATGGKLVRKHYRSVAAELFDRVAKSDRALTDVAHRLARGAKAIAQTPKRAVPKLTAAINSSSREDVDTEYRKYAERVRDVASTPDRAIQTVGAALGPTAERYPQLAATMGMKATQATQFLASKLPAERERLQTLTPLASEPYIPTEEKRKFLRYVEAFEDSPIELVREIETGRYPEEAVEVLKTQYPQVFAELRERVMAQTAELEDELPYQRRLKLGRLFEFPADAIQEPEYAQTIQAVYSQEQEPPPKASGGPTQTPTDSPLTTGLMTAGQRRAAGG